MKTYFSPSYNYIFNEETGFFARWGKTRNDDPVFSPVGPEILDLELTTICNGYNGTPCPFCYKANTKNGTYMPFEVFKNIFHKFPDTLTQVAFGVDARCESNPDTWRIFEYCRENDVIPNVTVANISNDTADRLTALCGAVAVSRYADENICYDTVKKLTNRGMNQVNIHQMISNETFSQTARTCADIKNDSRLEKLNAIVFLSLKTKGRGISYTPLDFHKFGDLVRTCIEGEVSFGFDSCTAPKFIEVCEQRGDLEKYISYIEPCESSLFSAYVNVEGRFFPCSFTEGENGHEEGIDLLEIEDFMKEVWFSPYTKQFRENLIANKRNCPIFNV